MDHHAGTGHSRSFAWSIHIPSEWTKALFPVQTIFEDEFDLFRDRGEIIQDWMARQREAMQDGADAVCALYKSDPLYWNDILQDWTSGAVHRAVKDMNAMVSIMAPWRRSLDH